ncbi:MAG TPA: cob(I)yrinic acid a,c-diamide adenosyltransferase [Planctomycetes bacterium]|nr:cob(I)yrinic acid a,c-diamide adenosyltransferase [Planctomycetota bacterium]
MKIYTKTGDQGETGLFDGTRVPKEDPRVDAYGTVDELNSILGLILCEDLEKETEEGLRQLQRDLFELGSDLATPGGNKTQGILEKRTAALETWMDGAMEVLPKMKSFILPGGTREAALFHLARTVARRAERLAWKAKRTQEIPDRILVYLNRLSDLLFVLARLANFRKGREDIPWERS